MFSPTKALHVSLTLLVSIAFFMLILSSTAPAGVVTTSADVGNAVPSVVIGYFDDDVSITGGSNQTILCNATITDLNGYQDISTARGELYISPASEGDSDDNNNHYSNASCFLTTGTGNTKGAECNFTFVQFNAIAGEWTCMINASDGTDTGKGDDSTLTIQETVSMTTPASIAYGTVALGGYSDNKTVAIGDNGNVPIDLQVDSAAAMSCDTGTVPVNNTHYNATLQAYDIMCNLTTDGADTCAPVKTDFDLAKSTTSSGTSVPTSKDTYWTLKMPASGVDGSCTGSITFTGVKST